MSSAALSEKHLEAREHICLALDLNDEKEILAAVDELSDLVGYVKLNSAFTLFGPELVRKIRERGVKIFLDLKLHDIPNTLKGYGEAVTQLDVQIVTIHVSGGVEMMQAVVASADGTAQRLGRARPTFIGIALLTSISQQIMNDEMNVQGSVDDEVLRKANLADAAGLDGIVCSAAELAHVRPHLREDFMYITPGVRPAGASGDDHKRAVTHAEAIAAGSKLLVVGRAVLGAEDRRAAAHGVIDDVVSAL